MNLDLFISLLTTLVEEDNLSKKNVSACCDALEISLSDVHDFITLGNYDIDKLDFMLQFYDYDCDIFDLLAIIPILYSITNERRV